MYVTRGRIIHIRHVSRCEVARTKVGRAIFRIEKNVHMSGTYWRKVTRDFACIVGLMGNSV